MERQSSNPSENVENGSVFQQVKKIFHTWDLDGSGTLSSEEIKLLLESFVSQRKKVEKVNVDHFMMHFLVLEKNNNEQISWTTFVTVISRTFFQFINNWKNVSNPYKVHAIQVGLQKVFQTLCGLSEDQDGDIISLATGPSNPMLDDYLMSFVNVETFNRNGCEILDAIVANSYNFHQSLKRLVLTEFSYFMYENLMETAMRTCVPLFTLPSLQFERLAETLETFANVLSLCELYPSGAVRRISQQTVFTLLFNCLVSRTFHLEILRDTISHTNILFEYSSGVSGGETASNSWVEILRDAQKRFVANEVNFSRTIFFDDFSILTVRSLSRFAKLSAHPRLQLLSLRCLSYLSSGPFFDDSHKVITSPSPSHSSSFLSSISLHSSCSPNAQFLMRKIFHHCQVEALAADFISPVSSPRSPILSSPWHERENETAIPPTGSPSSIRAKSTTISPSLSPLAYPETSPPFPPARMSLSDVDQSSRTKKRVQGECTEITRQACVLLGNICKGERSLPYRFKVIANLSLLQNLRSRCQELFGVGEELRGELIANVRTLTYLFATFSGHPGDWTPINMSLASPWERRGEERKYREQFLMQCENATECIAITVHTCSLLLLLSVQIKDAVSITNALCGIGYAVSLAPANISIEGDVINCVLSLLSLSNDLSSPDSASFCLLVETAAFYSLDLMLRTSENVRNQILKTVSQVPNLEKILILIRTRTEKVQQKKNLELLAEAGSPIEDEMTFFDDLYENWLRTRPETRTESLAVFLRKDAGNTTRMGVLANRSQGNTAFHVVSPGDGEVCLELLLLNILAASIANDRTSSLFFPSLANQIEQLCLQVLHKRTTQGNPFSESKNSVYLPLMKLRDRQENVFVQLNQIFLNQIFDFLAVSLLPLLQIPSERGDANALRVYLCELFCSQNSFQFLMQQRMLSGIASETEFSLLHAIASFLSASESLMHLANNFLSVVVHSVNNAVSTLETVNSMNPLPTPQASSFSSLFPVSPLPMEILILSLLTIERVLPYYFNETASPLGDILMHQILSILRRLCYLDDQIFEDEKGEQIRSVSKKIFEEIKERRGNSFSPRDGALIGEVESALKLGHASRNSADVSSWFANVSNKPLAILLSINQNSISNFHQNWNHPHAIWFGFYAVSFTNLMRDMRNFFHQNIEIGTIDAEGGNYHKLDNETSWAMEKKKAMQKVAPPPFLLVPVSYQSSHESFLMSLPRIQLINTLQSHYVYLNRDSIISSKVEPLLEQNMFNTAVKIYLRVSLI